MKVTYHPLKGDTAPITLFGYRFAPLEPVTVTDVKALRKFEGNRFFKVAEDGAAGGGKVMPLVEPPQTPATPVGGEVTPSVHIAPEQPADLPPVTDPNIKAIMTVDQAGKVAENGSTAAKEGKPRAVPVAYRKYDGGAEAWLAAYDSYKKPE